MLFDSTGTFEGFASLFNLGPGYAIPGMVIDQAHCLHKGINGRWSDKFPAHFFQVFREGD